MRTQPKYYCQCPFYLGEGKKGIFCEGVDGARKLIMEFKTGCQKDTYIKRHCCAVKPKDCPIYNLIMEMYDEEAGD